MSEIQDKLKELQLKLTQFQFRTSRRSRFRIYRKLEGMLKSNEALSRALDLFLARPELGFVWLAHAADGAVAGACIVCHAISTARGTLVAKLDDVAVDPRRQGQGVGSAMLAALVERLKAQGISRIDTACHRANAGAWRFYARLGFRPLDEERITLLIPGTCR